MSARFISVMAGIFLLPYLGFMGLGFYWLWEHQWLYQAISIVTANSLLIYTLVHYRSQKSKSKNINFPLKRNQNWTDDAKLAAEALEAVKERWKNESDLLTNSNKVLRLTNEVLTTVAKYFHNDSKYPILEFPLPYLLKLISLVCNDMQREILNNIPGSHVITISTLLQTKETIDTIRGKTWLNGVRQASFNLPAFVMSKASSMLLMKGFKKYVAPEVSHVLTNIYINKLGYYAIQLYSGQITLDDIEPTRDLTFDSKIDIEEVKENEKTLEPLRILILGQVSSGKSSLINALFGEVKSAVSILPTTSKITPYILERDGLQQAIILDSAGYGGLTANVLPDNMEKEWTKIDIVLMVCSASNAARSVDVEQLNTIRYYFQEHRKQAMPVIIGVATHIDRLRPIQEWQPPYNVQKPENPKSQSIRAFCEAIANDLSLPLKNIVPVCLNPDIGIYNIDDGLIPMIYEQFNDDVQRVRYLRCLRSQQNKNNLQQLLKQASTLGRVIFG